MSLYPSNVWARAAAAFGGVDEPRERMWLSPVDVSGPLLDQLAAEWRSLGIHAVIGVIERESERPGTLYNAHSEVREQGDRVPAMVVHQLADGDREALALGLVAAIEVPGRAAKMSNLDNQLPAKLGKIASVLHVN